MPGHGSFILNLKFKNIVPIVNFDSEMWQTIEKVLHFEG